MKWYVEYDGSDYFPAPLTDDLVEEAATQGWEVYDTLEECEAACNYQNKQQ
jgi:hypothetical protein